MPEWWLSAYVNLLAAGVGASTAKATILLSCPPDTASQTACAAIIDANAADGATMGAQAFSSRVPAAGWTYLTSSPYQTYTHT